MFTCRVSRAVYIKVTLSLDTDSFILALRQLTARRLEMFDQYTLTMDVILLVQRGN